ncbi:MAG: carboxypeptidase-like regulatory domain-containing protein, partial [Planctomycetota bacterium]
MKKRLQNGLLLALILVLLFSDGSILAGVSGKISGVVEDIGTGDPLVGATIRVAGTTLITSTDNDGEYFFLNVPIGKIDVVVTHVGFDTMTKRDVRVLVDLTTPVDFALKQMALELAESVVVYADAPVIQRDLTASRNIFTADRLKKLPNIVSVQNVLTNYPGV